MGNDEEDYGEEYGSSEDGSYLDLPAAEDEGEYEYYDEEAPEDEESEEEYYDEEEEEVEELTKGRRSLKKTKTIGETPDNQEQLDMLEKLAK